MNKYKEMQEIVESITTPKEYSEHIDKTLKNMIDKLTKFRASKYTPTLKVVGMVNKLENELGRLK